MILSLVAMAGLEKCCIKSAYLQWRFHSSERALTHGPLVIYAWQGLTAFALMIAHISVTGDFR